MYLEPWMIVTLIIAFGVCAVVSRKAGFMAGGTVILKFLENEKLIRITEEGTVARWSPHFDKETKNQRN